RVGRVVDAAPVEPRDGLGPFERRLLLVREQRRLAPDRDVMDAQVALAVDLRLLHVHVEAEGAAVELRGADVDEVEQRRAEGARLGGLGELEKLLEQLGALLGVVGAGAHGSSLSLSCGAAPARRLSSCRTRRAGNSAACSW